MGVKQDTLQATADTVIDFTNGEIPDVTKWNQGRDALQSSLPTIGGWLDDLETDFAALVALFEADHDPISGLNPAPGEWTIHSGVGITFVNASTVRLAGDHRSIYRQGLRIRFHLTTGNVIAALSQVTFNATFAYTELTLDTAVLDATVDQVAYPLVRDSMPKARSIDILAGAVGTTALGTSVVTAEKIAPKAIVESKHADGGVSTRALADLAATKQKLAVGASLYQFGIDINSSDTALTASARTVLTVNLTTRGGPVLMLAHGQAELESGERVSIRLKRDGFNVRVMNVGQANTTVLYTGAFAMQALEVPTAAAHVFTVEVLANGGSNVDLDDLQLIVMELA